ncbi:TPA: hypothetical protein ACFRG8_000497 [Neisseria lactamica]
MRLKKTDPAFVGMAADVSIFDKYPQAKLPLFPQKQKTNSRNLKSRHSRAGGNPVRPVSVSFEFRVISHSSFPRKRAFGNSKRQEFTGND